MDRTHNFVLLDLVLRTETTRL